MGGCYLIGPSLPDSKIDKMGGEGGLKKFKNKVLPKKIKNYMEIRILIHSCVNVVKVKILHFFLYS